jgi:hypothetical protein
VGVDRLVGTSAAGIADGRRPTLSIAGSMNGFLACVGVISCGGCGMFVSELCLEAGCDGKVDGAILEGMNKFGA